MRLAHASILALSVCSCQPRGDAASPGDSTGEVHLRFDTAALRSATCTLRIEDTTGPAGQSMGSRTAMPLAFAGSEQELAIRIRSAEFELAFGPETIRIRVTPELLEEPTDKGTHVVRRAVDDPNAKKRIEAITAAPHAFLRLDDHAGILDYREDLQTDVKIPALSGVGLSWALGVPHLPVEAVHEGSEWLGVRFLPNQADADPDRGIPVSYRLLRVRRGIATIAISSRMNNTIEASDTKIAGSVTIEGEAKVRVSDGRPLDTDVHVTLGFSSPEGSGGWEWRYVGSCEP
jgi:hypothetical protein